MINTLSRGARRNGRYANRSIAKPISPQATIAATRIAAAYPQRRRRRGIVRIEPEQRQQFGRERVADPRSQHDDVAMGEVDELQNPIHHRVAQCDQRIQPAHSERSDQRLDKVSHERKRVVRQCGKLSGRVSRLFAKPDWLEL